SKTPDLSAIPGGTDAPPVLPLALVLKACPDILDYASSPPRHWHELVALAGFVRGMMGISPDAWAEAERAMGAETAAITVAAILQRVSEIQSPGGYLRALSRKAAQGGFSPGPMVMALLRPMAA
ncbi:replication initiation protein RepC, partial [Rhodovulum sulfidophilum]